MKNKDDLSIVIIEPLNKCLTPNARNSKLAESFAEEALEDGGDDCDAVCAAIESLKCCIMISVDVRHPSKHFEIKRDILKKIKPIIHKAKPSLCSRESYEINQYEMFRTYYEIVKKLYIIESRHYYQSIGAPIPIRFKLASISGYNRWRNTIQYVTLFITFLSNIFKLALAKMGGRASFIGMVLQGIAHLSFALYFIFLTQDDRALALPKIFGLIISVISAVWIAEAGNGFL